MARDQVDMTPINSRDELVAWLEAGCKPKAEFRVGTEHGMPPHVAAGVMPLLRAAAAAAADRLAQLSRSM